MKDIQTPSRLVVILSLAFFIGIVSSGAVYWIVNVIAKNNQLIDSTSPHLRSDSSLSLGEQSDRPDLSGFSETSVVEVGNFEELENIESVFERGLAQHNYLTDLDESQLVDLLTQSRKIFAPATRDSLQFAGVQRLAQLNPSLALSQALELTRWSTTDLIGAVFQEWAHSDLDEAISRAQTLEEWDKSLALDAIVEERTDLSDDKLQTIARDLGNERVATLAIAQRAIMESIGDPEKTWNEIALGLQDYREAWRTITHVAAAWVEQSGLEVLDHISQSLTDPNARQVIVRGVLMDVASRDPAGALTIAKTLDNDPWNSTVRNITRTWAASDPQSALAAASEIEKLGIRRDAEESIITEWSHDDPRAVLEVIATLPEYLQFPAKLKAIRRIAQYAPEEAADLVAAMAPGSEKTQAASNVANIWSLQDHQAALEWVLNEPSFTEIRPSILHSLLYRLVDVDPQLAMHTALAQPVEEDESNSRGIGMEHRVVSLLVRRDLDRAIEILPQVREGPTRSLTVETVAAALVGEGEIDQAFAMARQISEADRESFYIAIATAWARHDPEGMLESMNRFPSPKAKSKAAIVIMRTNETDESLSDEQVEEARKFLSDEDSKNFEDVGSELMKDVIQQGLSF